ncbi:MbcA/ParS/Xre antitoxin family protein [Comamonas sp. 4034]
MNRPQPSLNLAKPVDLMLTEEGLAQVETLLKRMAVGALA